MDQRHVPLPAFDPTEIGPVQPAHVGEGLLRHSELLPPMAQGPAEAAPRGPAVFGFLLRRERLQCDVGVAEELACLLVGQNSGAEQVVHLSHEVVDFIDCAMDLPIVGQLVGFVHFDDKGLVHAFVQHPFQVKRVHVVHSGLFLGDPAPAPPLVLSETLLKVAVPSWEELPPLTTRSTYIFYILHRANTLAPQRRAQFTVRTFRPLGCYASCTYAPCPKTGIWDSGSRNGRGV